MRRTPLLRLRDYVHLVWCPRRARVACGAVLALLLSSCATRGTVAQTHNVSQDGSVSAGTRSAADAAPGVLGPQELAGIAIPAGPFMLKAALSWDGQPWFWTPPAPAPQAAAQSACQPMTVEVEETFTEMQPVQRTRRVQRQVVPLPVPQAIPQCAPAPQAAPRSCSCVDGKCVPPDAVTVACGK